jgi:hypothetical protein
MQAALLSAVSEILKIQMVKKYGKFDSAVLVDGKPAPLAPHLFAAVHDGGCFSEGGIDYGFKCECRFIVTFSVREVTLPPDKMGTRILSLISGFEKYRYDVIDALHMNYDVSSLATAKLAEYNLPGTFNTGDACECRGAMSPMEPQPPDWWWSQGEGFAGYSFSINFGNVRFMKSGMEMRQ